MKKPNIHYKEIKGRALYLLQDEGTAILTTGTPENHTHIELNVRDAKKLRKWLTKYIQRKRK